VPKYSEDWYIKVYIDAKRHIQKVGRQQRQAESVLRIAHGEVFQEKFFGHKQTEDLTWQEAVDRFNSFNDGACRPPTAKMYRDRLDLMGRLFFKDFTLSEVNDPELVNGYKKMRLKTGVSGSGINRELASIKRMISVFSDGSILTTKKKPYLEFNFLTKVKKAEENPSRERFPTLEEMVLLIKHAVNNKIRMYFYISLFTGLRPSNVKGLEWAEIDFKGKQIRIPATKSKNKKPIIIDLLDPLAVELLAWQGQLESPYVIPSRLDLNKPYKEEKTAFTMTCQAANITNLTPYCLRHGMATLLAELNDGNLRLVQKALSQNSLTMATKYTHVRDQVRITAMEKMGSELAGKINGQSTISQQDS
jgi:integrase